jgi:hypothetical protein
MGFDDFFENEHKRSRYGNNNHYDHDDHHDSSHSQHHSDHSEHGSGHSPFGSGRSRNGFPDIKQEYLGKIMNNPQLRSLIIIAVVAVFLILLVLVILLFPMIQQLFLKVGEEGIQGVANDLWNGSKN